MTIPALMNCEHMADGWCLDCVAALDREKDCLRAELAALQWQPIETAPEGDPFATVLIASGSCVGEAFWHDGSECHGHRGGAG